MNSLENINIPDSICFFKNFKNNNQPLNKFLFVFKTRFKIFICQKMRRITKNSFGYTGSGLMVCFWMSQVGLHQRDNERLIATLKNLRDMGNTLIVVEHDEDTIRSAGPYCRYWTTCWCSWWGNCCTRLCTRFD